MIQAHFETHFDGWRQEARRLLQLNAPPDQVMWSEESERSLFDFGDVNETPAPLKPATAFNVPKEFITLANFVACTRDPNRWSLLYRILYRLKNETPDLLKIASDNDVAKAYQMMKSVTKDIHKMHAFVRFKHVVQPDGQELYMAWHKPEHLIVKEATPFFVRRFGDKPWAILTPDLTASWDGNELKFSEGVPQHLFPHTDDFDELWKSYYSSIYNPARLNTKMMKSEMATKYWGSLPEAELIRDLIRETPERLAIMAKNQNTQALVPETNSLEELYTYADICKACPLHAKATQTVRGEGPAHSWLMIVGEQPGDQEDQTGKPFVGPAGEVLNDRLKLAGINRQEIYLTNAVKHFKWRAGMEGSDKARIHQKPSGSEMHACRPWLEAEIAKVKPKVIVALGVTAATSVLGRLPKITQERGKIIRGSPFAEVIIISWHPAAILRSNDAQEMETRKAQLAADLKLAASLQE